MIIALDLACGAMPWTHSAVMRSPWRSSTVELAVQLKNLRWVPSTSFSNALRALEKILKVGRAGLTMSSDIASRLRVGGIFISIRDGSHRGLLCHPGDQLVELPCRRVPTGGVEYVLSAGFTE